MAKANQVPAWLQTQPKNNVVQPVVSAARTSGRTAAATAATPAWMKPVGQQQTQTPALPTGTFFSGGKNYNVRAGEVPYDPRLLQSGYYKTGDNQNMTIRRQDGSVTRLGPNSMMTPTPVVPKSNWQMFMDLINGKPAQPSGVTGVRG